MKYSLIIDKNKEEEVIVIAHEKHELVEKIEKLFFNNDKELTGYLDDEIIILDISKIACFISEDNNVYALVGEYRYKVKKRLYQIEEILDDDFIKINQSCIANINQISRFKASFNGFLEVIFKNGYKDYVSRRELKNVKGRMGI